MHLFNMNCCGHNYIDLLMPLVPITVLQVPFLRMVSRTWYNLICQLFTADQWFSQSSLISSTNKNEGSDVYFWRIDKSVIKHTYNAKYNIVAPPLIRPLATQATSYQTTHNTGHLSYQARYQMDWDSKILLTCLPEEIRPSYMATFFFISEGMVL